MFFSGVYSFVGFQICKGIIAYITDEFFFAVMHLHINLFKSESSLNDVHFKESKNKLIIFQCKSLVLKFSGLLLLCFK